jgi:hypothetical protein
LVDAIDDRVLAPMGFRCLTVGRNISVPDQADDAIREIIDQVDCLVGIATVRLQATDPALPNRTLSLASPYVLEETAMAHQLRLPFLIFKAPEVALQGVTSRNLYIEIRPDMPNGRPVFLARKEVVLSSLRTLRTRALDVRKRRSRDQFLATVGKLSTFAVGTYAFGSFLDWLSRPNCFGTYHYLDAQCKNCSYKANCKAEKARRSSR